MATSSRIFVRNLPPAIKEDDFRTHFSKFSKPTDVRLFGPRRIGYVGFLTPEDATKAVKYFDRSFIRMSKINVEIARSKEEMVAPTARSYTAPAHTASIHATGANDVEVRDGGERQNLKRKRDGTSKEPADPKLKEYLEVMQAPSKSKQWADGAVEGLDGKKVAPAQDIVPVLPDEAASDDEYETMQKSSKKSKDAPKHDLDLEEESGSEMNIDKVEPEETRSGAVARKPISDLDWLQSKTKKSKISIDEEDEKGVDDRKPPERPTQQMIDDAAAAAQTLASASEHVAGDAAGDAAPTDDADTTTEDPQALAVRESKRLFVRNLPYTAIEDELWDHFSQYGTLEEAHLSMDKKTGKSKGFAFVAFVESDAAVEAYKATDSTTFQGRILHVIPATAKRENKLDEFALAKLPLKTQKLIKRKSEAASSKFNWNALYMNADSVVSSIADRLGIDKSEVLDPTSSEAAVKQALAETHIISETKNYFTQQGVDLEAFRRKRRGDTGILVKNFPYGTTAEELKGMFEEFGKVTRFLMPPTGTIAIVEFAIAPEARAAFKSLAYRRVKNSMLFLEPAPKDLFTTAAPTSTVDTIVNPLNLGSAAKATVTDLLREEETGPIETSTLFVKNLSFATTTQKLTDTFSPLTGFVSGRVKMKPDPKKAGALLSMGFGFLEFKTKEDAQAALAAMNNYSLDGHKLDLRASQRALDAAEDRRKEDRLKAQSTRRTKIVIKNLPFQASKKEIRSLFSSYGQLRSVRVPKKFDSTSRGFAFAEFSTPREAANAIEALRNTHLLGRKLVLDFAEEEAKDAEEEIERMARKVGSQSDKVALAKLTGGGRRKFNADAAGGLVED